MYDPLVIIAVIFGLYMAMNIGANDVANSMANAVGSRALTVFWAVVLASIFEFAGAFLVGGHVTNTVRKGIIDTQAFADNPYILAVGLVCALLAAATWLNMASWFGLPVSTTHSIVGAIAGFGVLRAGFGHVHWGTLGQVVASWFISPVAGGIIAFLVFTLIARFVLGDNKPVRAALAGVPITTFFVFVIMTLGTIIKGLKNLDWHPSLGQTVLISGLIGLAAAAISYAALRKLWGGHSEEESAREQLAKVERVFAVLVVITSCAVAFAHGSNDVANAIGPLAGVIEIVQSGAIPEQALVPNWVLALGGIGIVIGLSTFGYRVMRTVGSDITNITPSRGVAADIGATITVLTCSNMGLPISTTHTLVGAIIGVGFARGITGVNRATVMRIFFSWFATLPVVAIMTIIFYLIAHFAFGV
ncbi:MAG: inorganic phosphate transporter [Candidatus Hydrogenedentota bacterium]